jgi:hypothetical protein
VKLKTLRLECFPSHRVKGGNDYYYKLYPLTSYTKVEWVEVYLTRVHQSPARYTVTKNILRTIGINVSIVLLEKFVKLPVDKILSRLTILKELYLEHASYSYTQYCSWLFFATSD